MPEFIAFFACIPHSDLSSCLISLEQYGIGKYVIAKEITDTAHQEGGGEHLHFLVEIDKKNYHNFSEAIFRKKYKLRGKASAGLPRQYGMVKEIRDLPKMIAYTIKDKNYITNFDVSPYVELSYTKQESKPDKIKKQKVKTWSQNTTDTIRKNFPNYVFEFKAQDIMIITQEVLLCLGEGSKKISPMIIRDLVFGQYNALKPGCKEFTEFLYSRAFPELFGEYDKYIK